jgi:signal transduction histidine kinase
VFRSRFSEAAFRSSLAMPLSDQGELAGAVYLQELDTERAEGIWTVQRHLRTVSLTIGTAALVIGGLFVLLITRRIEALVDSMRAVAGGDYRYRHLIRGQDEISELGRELNQLTERLETNEAERRRFVADASHELKTPLASIRLLSDSIVQSEGMDGETMREFVADIGDEAKRLQRTTEKLLTLSRLDNEVSFVPEPVDLKQAALDALTLLRPLAQEKGVRLRSELREGCVVMGSRDDMDHILSNLIENAIKYNVPGGSVLVRLQAGEDLVSLSVEDTGIGIPEADRPNIFERFYRSGHSSGSGYGIGLAFARKIAISQNGSLQAANSPGGGALFDMRIYGGTA